MLASLPMYDLPEIRKATDGFWSALAQVIGTDIHLTRGDDWSAPWHESNLLFSQTCGYPFSHEFANQLIYVATPIYNAEGCVGPNYCSILFAQHQKDIEHFKGGIAAYNSKDSMSGFLALKLACAEHQSETDAAFFSASIETGSHANSLATVQAGRAHICAIDCVTVALLKRYRPAALAGLKEIARSALVPGLPYVTRAGNSDKLQNCLKHLRSTPQLREHFATLLLKDFSFLSADAYSVIPQLERSVNKLTFFPD